MFYRKTSGIVFICTVFISVFVYGTPLETNSVKTKILFIGSSYLGFNNLVDMFENLALSSGENVLVDQRIVYGTYLSFHSSDETTRQKIYEEDWDFVILQGGSHFISKEKWHELVIPHIKELDSVILDNCSTTKTVYMMPWAYKDGLEWMPGQTDDYDLMQNNIYREVVKFAEDSGVYVAPVGWAWYSILSVPRVPYIELYALDLNHPSKKGSYLTACVFVATLFKKDLANVPFYADLDEDEAILLQKTASDTVLFELANWNLEPETQPTISYRLPHFDQEKDLWSTSLTLVNLSTVVNELFLTAYSEEGILNGNATIILPAGGGVSSSLSDFMPDLMIEKGWINVESGNDDLSGIVTFSYIPNGGTTSLPVISKASDCLVFPLIENSEKWSSGFVITNINDIEIEVIIKAKDYQGIIIESVEMLLPAFGKRAQMVDDVFVSELPERIILTINGTEKIIGFALTLSKDNQTIVAVPASM